MYFYFVKIETIKGKKIDATLSRFSEDSIFIIPVEKKYVPLAGIVFKIILSEEETSIAADSISVIHIRKDKNIVYADSFKKRSNKAVIKSLALEALSFVVPKVVVSAFPVTGGLEGLSAINSSAIILASAAAAGGALAVTTAGKKFKLNGDKKKYNEMLLKLTKVNTDPDKIITDN